MQVEQELQELYTRNNFYFNNRTVLCLEHLERRSFKISLYFHLVSDQLDAQFFYIIR
jgi:hypothetical protein